MCSQRNAQHNDGPRRMASRPVVGGGGDETKLKKTDKCKPEVMHSTERHKCMHLYCLCQTWLNLKTHTVSETEKVLGGGGCKTPLPLKSGSRGRPSKYFWGGRGSMLAGASWRRWNSAQKISLTSPLPDMGRPSPPTPTLPSSAVSHPLIQQQSVRPTEKATPIPWASVKHVFGSGWQVTTIFLAGGLICQPLPTLQF